MRKVNVKCVVEFVDLNGIFNNEIYHYLGGEWTNCRLAMCINCGELFVYNLQGLDISKLTLQQKVAGTNCPKCRKQLENTIVNYPDTFMTKNGAVGHLSGFSFHYDKNFEKTIDVNELF